MFVEEPAQERQPHDLEVELHRPVFDVIQVVLDALLDGGVAPPAVDLRPAGDAGLDLVTQHVLRDLVLELRDEKRTLGPRSDNRHVALEHVPELGQFVDVGLAQELADWRPPRILFTGEHRSGFGFGVLVHRPELVNHERLAVEPHPLLAVEDVALRRQLDQGRDDPEGDGQHQQGARGNRDVDAALDEGVEALQRHVVDVDDRQAVELFESRAQRDYLQQVGHHLDVHELAARAFDEPQHLDVLLGRQRNVQLIDTLACRDFGGVVDSAKQRQPAVSEVIARGLVIHEADDLIAQLAVLEDLVRDQASQFARSGDEDALQADARAPAPLEHFAHQFARRVGQRHVEHEENGPDRLRYLELSARPCRRTREIHGHVQRRDDAEQDGEDAADEHRKEIVDARPAAPQPVEPLELETKWDEDRDERQVLDVLPQWRHTFRDGNQEWNDDGMESKRVRDDERGHREERVREDMKRDEEAVVAVQHLAYAPPTPAGASAWQAS